MSEAQLADPARIAKMIDDLGRIGAEPSGGVSRLAYTADERSSHAVVGKWLEAVGLDVGVDAVGNTIATLAGTDPKLPAIGIGSHLDSVYHGGRYDGAAGVVVAVEVANLLHEQGITLRHPLRVVAFAAEEGARFGEPCIGSKAVIGRWSQADLSARRDRDGMSLAEAMTGVGMDPRHVTDARWSPQDWAAFLELHIEQANVLERAGIPIGLVDMVSGSTRLTLNIRGQAQHSGGTPMATRADALVAAAEIILEGERIANDYRHRGTRVTVGRLESHPNSITTITGSVAMSVDVRDIDSERQRETAVAILSRAYEIGERRGVDVDGELLADTSPTVLPMWLRTQVASACDAAGHDYRVMTSGASHDAQVVNRVVPAAIVFVPSRGGLSHVPEEWTSASELARGADVMVSAVQRIDDFLADLAPTTPRS